MSSLIQNVSEINTVKNKKKTGLYTWIIYIILCMYIDM